MIFTIFVNLNQQTPKIHFPKTILRFPKMDIKSMSIFHFPKIVCQKKVFFYANKSKIFFSKMRAFSRKITFLHILAIFGKFPDFCPRSKKRRVF